MERGKSKAVTGKEHLERNDFIIEKQKAELQRIEAIKRHKERQVNLAEQELRQVKSEIRTDKLKSAATDAATVIASGVGSLFGSGKMKKLEQSNEELRQEIAKRDKGIDDLKVQMQRMQEQHGKQIRNLQEIHNQELEAKDKDISRLNTLARKGIQMVPDAQGDAENGKVVRCYWLYQRNDRKPSDHERGYQMQRQDLFRRTQTEV